MAEEETQKTTQNNQLEETPQVTKEIVALETMNELVETPPAGVAESKLSDTPLDNVEKDLSRFTTDMFDVIRDKNNFNKAIENEIIRRLSLSLEDGGFDSREIIALQNNSAVNYNDVVSKVLGPTFQLMTAEQQAVYASKQAEAKQQGNITINTANMGNDQMRQLNESKEVDQKTLQGLNQLNNLLQGFANVSALNQQSKEDK